MKKKNYAFVWRRIVAGRIVFMFALLFSLPAASQDILYDIPNYLAESPIIRNYKEDVDIQYQIYLDHSPQTFDYVDRSNNTIISYPMGNLDESMVFDFEVLGDYVYFCGLTTVSLTRWRGVFGWFHIDSLFFYGGGIHYYELPDTSISEFHKLDVVEVGGYVHMVMVGAKLYDNQYTSIVADAWRLMPSWDWKINYIEESPERALFRDVAITEHYAVVLALLQPATNSTGAHGIIAYHAPTPATANQNIFGVPVGDSILIGICRTDTVYFKPYSSYMHIVEMEHNSFATVCMNFKNSPSVPVVVSLYSTPLSNPYKRFSFSVEPGADEIQEVAYNFTKQVLCMVPEEFSMVYCIPHPYDYVYREKHGYNWLSRSIDNVKNTQFFTIAGTTGSFMEGRLWKLDASMAESTRECVDAELYEISLLDEEQSMVYRWQEVKDCMISPHEWRDYTYSLKMIIKCR